jgi:hypothetical protein
MTARLLAALARLVEAALGLVIAAAACLLTPRSHASQ